MPDTQAASATDPPSAPSGWLSDPVFREAALEAYPNLTFGRACAFYAQDLLEAMSED